jgi:hypothetical protein
MRVLKLLNDIFFLLFAAARVGLGRSSSIQRKQLFRRKKLQNVSEYRGEFTNVKQLFRQRFDACVNKSLMK